MLRATDLLTRLVAEFPEESHYQSLLAAAEMDLGVFFSRVAPARRAAPTKEATKKEATSIPALPRAAPAAGGPPTRPTPSIRVGLANCFHNLGATFSTVFNHKEAVAEYRLALPIREKLVADHPDRPRYRESLAFTLDCLADNSSDSASSTRPSRPCAGQCEVCREARRRLPRRARLPRRVATASEDLGLILAQRGRNREAREAFERAYEIRAQARRRPPRPCRDYRHNLAAHLLRRGRQLRHAHRTGGPRRRPRRALARESVEIEPQEPGFWKGLALAEYRAGDLDAALKAETKALELRKSRTATPMTGCSWP